MVSGVRRLGVVDSNGSKKADLHVCDMLCGGDGNSWIRHGRVAVLPAGASSVALLASALWECGCLPRAYFEAAAHVAGRSFKRESGAQPNSRSHSTSSLFGENVQRNAYGLFSRSYPSWTLGRCIGRTLASCANRIGKFPQAAISCHGRDDSCECNNLLLRRDCNCRAPS